MAQLTFSNAFSWKRGFLVNKLQHISKRNVDRNNLPKDRTKVACPHATLTRDTYQWKITTSKAVATTASVNREATDPASLPINNRSAMAFQTSHVQSTQENTSKELLSSMRKAPTPYKTAGFNKGDLHCALPIRGLLPEDTLHNDNT